MNTVGAKRDDGRQNNRSSRELFRQAKMALIWVLLVLAGGLYALGLYGSSMMFTRKAFCWAQCRV
jgi:flagellar basal body-associated protein FliL